MKVLFVVPHTADASAKGNRFAGGSEWGNCSGDPKTSHDGDKCNLGGPSLIPRADLTESDGKVFGDTRADMMAVDVGIGRQQKWSDCNAGLEGLLGHCS